MDNPNVTLPKPTQPYVPAGHFLSLLLAVDRDYAEMAHEVQVVLTDLLGASTLWDHAQVAGRGGILCGTNERATTYEQINATLIRVADRYRVPALFWSHGWLHAAEAPQHAGMGDLDG